VSGPRQPGPAHLDGATLLDHLDALAASAPSASGPGVTRLAWSAAEQAGRALVASWLAGSAVIVTTDPVGNLVADWPGTDPGLAPIVMGSHLDTVVDGGRLDGAYGTVTAFEIVGALAAVGEHLRHPVRAVAWANEEGVVAPPFTGSLAVTGAPVALDATGPDGRTLRQRLTVGGGDPDRCDDLRWPPVAAYLELHIEQGPVLEAAGIGIGVVTGITGNRRGTVTVSGTANHAGTTPMDRRRDALAVAAPLVDVVRRLATDGPADVATVGAMTVHPGNVNVVPGSVTLTYDIRSLDDAGNAAALDHLRAAVDGAAAAGGVGAAVSPTYASAAVATDARLRAAVHDAATALGLPTMELASGAGHDAQHLAALGPMGMIFVPSVAGLSHNPGEATADADLVAGAETLLATLRLADGRLDP
jgi:hydantoinase/carbamoylase family amidase